MGMEKWNQKLQKHIRAQGMTITEAAAHLDIGRSALGHWLSGRRTPDAWKFKEIASFMGISVAELIEDDPDFARNNAEKDMLAMFRQLPPNVQAQAKAVIRALQSQQDLPPAE